MLNINNLNKQFNSTTSDNVIDATGVEGTITLGSITVIAANVIVVEGVVGTGETERVNVWGLIADDQTPNYSAISTTQTANYSSIDEAQTANWKEVA